MIEDEMEKIRNLCPVCGAQKFYTDKDYCRDCAAERQRAIETRRQAARRRAFW